jgi:D-alanyl-D-alanine carboxypeptidase
MRMLKSFSPAEFVALFSAIALPDTSQSEMTPVLTGHVPADDRIRTIAHEQGYALQPVAMGDLVCIDARKIDGHLQPLAARGWHQLTSAAHRSGITLAFVSGFRSWEIQQALFVDRLRAAAVRHLGRPEISEEIAAGVADDLVRSVLSETAPPGYSRHHTGYALDLLDAASGLPFTQFQQTAAYRWLAADNFARAKACGFIPSYPESGPRSGPHPEAWEFVWVGTRYVESVHDG